MRKTLFLGLLLATGCTSVERLRPDVEARTPPSRLEEIAYINVLREAFEPAALPASSACYDGDDRYFRGELSQGYPAHTGEQEGLPEWPRGSTTAPPPRPQCITFRQNINPAQIRRYLEAGFGLSDIYCQRFFIAASQASLRRRFIRNVGANVDTLMGTVLSLASAGEDAIGIVNAGFGAVDSTFQNFDDSFLVAPDLENVRALVHAAQDAYRKESLTSRNYTSYPAARAVIERYAGICSYTGMRRLVNVSVGDQTRRLQGQTDNRSVAPAATPPERLPAAVPVPPSSQ